MVQALRTVEPEPSINASVVNTPPVSVGLIIVGRSGRVGRNIQHELIVIAARAQIMQRHIHADVTAGLSIVDLLDEQDTVLPDPERADPPGVSPVT